LSGFRHNETKIIAEQGYQFLVVAVARGGGEKQIPRSANAPGAQKSRFARDDNQIFVSVAGWWSVSGNWRV
jgi:hypothetical protein